MATAMIALANWVAAFRTFVNEWIALMVAMLALHAMWDVKDALRAVRAVSIGPQELGDPGQESPTLPEPMSQREPRRR